MSQQITIKVRKSTLDRLDSAHAKLMGTLGRTISRAAYLDAVASKLDHIHDELVKELKVTGDA